MSFPVARRSFWLRSRLSSAAQRQRISAMKIFRYIVQVLLVFPACEQQENPVSPEPQLVEHTLYASTPGDDEPQTRTVISAADDKRFSGAPTRVFPSCPGVAIILSRATTTLPSLPPVLPEKARPIWVVTLPCIPTMHRPAMMVITYPRRCLLSSSARPALSPTAT